MVGDLAGFCAATYQRGVRYVQVPTTLVAQVDSAYGGKTGVDLAEAKNYVGAFHQPSAVIADTATLDTLPPAELAAGYAEVVKTALIAGGELWERVRQDADPTDPALIAACALAKLRIVARDERDAGIRQVLNLGHTVGHAIETVTGYASYRHGEAVALGLLAALRLSDQPDLRDEVAQLLRTRGLPTRLEHADPDAVVMATARDKKRLGEGSVPFVLLDAPGAAADRMRRRAQRPDRRGPRAGGLSADAQPGRSHARRQPRPARSPRSRPLRAPHVRRARTADQGGRRRARPRGPVLPDQPRGRVRRAPAPARGPRRRDRAQPRRLDALLVRDPRRARARRAARRSRSTCPTSTRARSGGASR